MSEQYNCQHQGWRQHIGVMTCLHKGVFNSARRQEWSTKTERETLKYMRRGRILCIEATARTGRKIRLINLHQATSRDLPLQQRVWNILSRWHKGSRRSMQWWKKHAKALRAATQEIIDSIEGKTGAAAKTVRQGGCARSAGVISNALESAIWKSWEARTSSGEAGAGTGKHYGSLRGGG